MSATTATLPVSPAAVLPPDGGLEPRRVPFTVIDEAVHLLDTPAEPWGIQLELPAAVVVTVKDKLIRCSRQQALAKALNAHPVDIAGHHNAWLVLPEEWASALDDAIQAVSAASPGAHGDPVLRGEDRPLAEARAAHG